MDGDWYSQDFGILDPVMDVNCATAIPLALWEMYVVQQTDNAYASQELVVENVILVWMDSLDLVLRVVKVNKNLPASHLKMVKKTILWLFCGVAHRM